MQSGDTGQKSFHQKNQISMSIDADAAVPMDGFFVFITEAGIIAARNSNEVSSVDRMD